MKKTKKMGEIKKMKAKWKTKKKKNQKILRLDKSRYKVPRDI